jgi:hypothetical protein
MDTEYYNSPIILWHIPVIPLYFSEYEIDLFLYRLSAIPFGILFGNEAYKTLFLVPILQFKSRCQISGILEISN